MSINEQEQQRSQITKVINLGREQNYLTYAQINDLLPNIVDTEHFDVIISMLEGMNIKVFEVPPSEDELALLGNTEEIPEDVEEAAMVLASVDKETGRTTDPVRMYMREMGSVELLTREGEIKIAKRIEEGTIQVLRSLASYPETIEVLLQEYDKTGTEELRLSDIILGFMDEEISVGSEDALFVAGDELPEDIAEDLEVTEGDDGSITEVDDGPNPEQAKIYFDDLREKFEIAIQALNQYGRTHAKTVEAFNLMAESFLKLKLTSRQVDVLMDHFREMRLQIRDYERLIMRLCIEKAKMPRKVFY